MAFVHSLPLISSIAFHSLYLDVHERNKLVTEPEFVIQSVKSYPVF